MAKYTDFLPYVLPYVSGCPVPLAEQHVRDICIDFCSHTLFIQQALDPVTAKAGVADYDLEAPFGYRVQQILRAWYETQPIAVLNADSGAHRPEQHNTLFTGADTGTGIPRALLRNGSSFKLDIPPKSDSASAITLYAALTPTRASTTVDDRLFEEYAYEIGQGAVARLLMLPGQAFSAPTVAPMYHMQYQSARAQARIRAAKSFERSENRIRPVRF